MSVTRAGQIQCKKSQDISNNVLSKKWYVDPKNGFGGQVHFTEYLLSHYNYYKGYIDDLGKEYFDIRFILEGFDQNNPSPDANLSKAGDLTDQVINNKDIYRVVFKPFINNRYTQKFSLVLYDSKNDVELVVKSFLIPAKTQPQEYEVFFCPESFGISNSFDQIILKVDRSDENSKNIIMELEKFELYKLNNLLEDLKDENNQTITELLGLEIETVNRGECLFFINFDSFWVGNDRVLNIDESLEVSIQKLAYVRYNKTPSANFSTSDYITALVNYKY